MGAKFLRWVSSLVATLNDRMIGRGWRRVFALAVVPLALGIFLILGFKSSTVDELGVGFVGGAVLGLVFAIAQFTLDQQTADRQERSDLALALSSTNDLTSIDLAGRDLTRSYLRAKPLDRANLDDACLVEANLAECELQQATLRRANLRGADMRGSDMRGAVLDDADLREVDLREADLSGTSLVGVDLTGAMLVDVGPRADDAAKGLDLGRTDLSRAVLDGARLDGANLADSLASFASAYRVEATDVVLSRSDLSCADLRAANLHRANLSAVDLSGADLTGAELSGADLRGARLVGTCLAGANLSGALVDRADFRAADLRDIQHTNVDFSNADLTDSLRTPALASSETGANLLLSSEDPHGGPGDPQTVPPPRRLYIVPAERGLRDLAKDVATVLTARRAALVDANDRLAQVDPIDGIPHFGDPADHGLSETVRGVRRAPWRRAPVAVLRREGPDLQVGVRPAGMRWGPRPRRSLRRAAGPWTTVPHGAAARGADSIQLALGADLLFSDTRDLTEVGTWLDGGDVEHDAARRAEHATRNPVALVVRAWRRQSSDLADMELAVDEARTAWAATRSPLWRAIAAARLGWAQGQICHRSAAPDFALARAKSAADWAARRLDRISDERPESVELRILELKGLLGQSLAYSGGETFDVLVHSMRLGEEVVDYCERHGLPPSLSAINSLGYQRMARAGRFTRGAGHGEYVIAADAFLQILRHYARVDGPAEDFGGDSVVDLVAAVRARHDEDKLPGHEHATDEQRARERPIRLALVNLGNLCRLYRRYDDAIACYDAAIDNDPDYIEAYVEEAWVLLDRGKVAEADANVETMLSCHGGTPGQVAKNLVNYAEALGRVGHWPYQRPWLLEALRRNPGNERARRLLTEWEGQAHMPGTTEGRDTADVDADQHIVADAPWTPSATWPAPRLRPDTYPGLAPDYSYLLVGDRVFPLDVRCTRDILRIGLENGTTVAERLEELGVDPLGERVPVIAYGANRSPHSLALKFSHHGKDDGEATNVVPVLAGTLHDVDTVAVGLSSQGFIYADLVDSPGTSIQVMLALLDSEQLAAIHDSEDIGRMYDCTWLPGFSIAGTEGTVAGMGYIGRRPVFQVPEATDGPDAGEPLAFSMIAAQGRNFRSLSQMDMMARIIEVTGVGKDLAELLRARPGTKPRALADDLVRLLNGQWWYRHNTGDTTLKVAREALNTVSAAIARCSKVRDSSSPLTSHIITPDVAYAPGPEFRLAHQVELP